jgi:hypothetical protein
MSLLSCVGFIFKKVLWKKKKEIVWSTQGGDYRGNEDGFKEMTNWVTPFLVVYKLKSCFTYVFIKDIMMLYQQEKLCFQIK